jgi:hypothetical protein
MDSAYGRGVLGESVDANRSRDQVTPVTPERSAQLVAPRVPDNVIELIGRFCTIM